MDFYIMPIVWAVVFIAALWVEAETCEMVALWFMPGAIAALVLSLCRVEWWIQLVVFIGLSAVLLVMAKTVLKKYIVKRVGQEKTDTDLLIGKTVKVEEDIDNSDERGAVRVNGQIWSARMADATQTAAAGESVIVESISGVKLICRKP